MARATAFHPTQRGGSSPPHETGPSTAFAGRHEAGNSINSLVGGDRLRCASVMIGARSEDGPVSDDQLRLIFTCCHPALRTEHQVALTLRLLGGLSVEEVARSFLVSESAMAKRLVRAKYKIKAANIPVSGAGRGRSTGTAPVGACRWCT